MARKKNYVPKDEVMYHIGFCANQLQGATLAVLPGDPGRVKPLAEALSDAGTEPIFIATHREYTSYLATVGGKKILVCSTGMGGPSVGIGLEEMARIGLKRFIRFGTTGSIQEEVNMGDIIITSAAVRLEGTSHHYAPAEYPAVASYKIVNALEAAAAAVGTPYHVGITVSSDTFWPGQERYDSFTGYVRKEFQGTLKDWQALGCLNYEMEAATLFTICSVFGLEAGAVCGVVAKRTDSEVPDPGDSYTKAFNYMIKTTVGAIKLLNK